MLPPPNRKMNVSKAMLPPASIVRKIDTTMAPPFDKSRQVISKVFDTTLPQNGTLATILTSSKNDKISSQRRLSQKEQQKNNADSKSDSWRAPEDQTGDGRTKLNDRYGGRY